MKKREWTWKEKAIVALVAVVVSLFFGLVRGAKYPALVTVSATHYPRDYDEDGDYLEKTRCWGIPIIYWRCTTTLEPRDTESEPG